MKTRCWLGAFAIGFLLLTHPTLATASSVIVAQADGEDAAAAPAAKPEREVSTTANDSSFRRLTFDIGGASNLSNGSAAYEAHLGVNIFVFKWLVWRNAPFYRSQTGVDAEYGLDSSVDGRYGIKVADNIEPNIMLGAGYRVVNVSVADAPFVEGGLGVQVGGIGVDASVKQIFHSVTTPGLDDERLYSVNFSGGVNF